MLNATFNDFSQACCPMCLATKHVVYRRIPEQNGIIAHHCQCQCCGEWYAIRHDRVGNLYAV